MRKTRSPLAVIFLTIFVDLLGIGILIPVIPQLLGNPNSSEFLLPPGMTLAQGYVMLGILMASYPAAQFFAAPILGQLSDRYGRRPVLIASLAGTALGYALFAIAVMMRNIPLLFASRILDGITGGNLPVAQAVIADVTTPENRAKNFGLVGAAFGIGFIIGPYIGGQLADPRLVSWFTAATPFWFAAILSVINMLLLMSFLPETHPRRSISSLDWSQSLKHIAKAFSMERLRWLFVTGFLYFCGFSFFVSFFGVFLIYRYGFTESNTGNLFAYIGIWIAVTQAFLTPVVHRTWGERRVLNVTFAATGAVSLLFLLPGPWQQMLFLIPIFAIFNGLSQANFMGLLSRSADQDVQGEVLGINASVSAVSQAIPPALSGFIAAQSAPLSTLVVGGVIMIIAGIVFLARVRRDPSLQSPMKNSGAD